MALALSLPALARSRWAARAWLIVAFGGLAAFVLHTVLGDRLGHDQLFNVYLYNVLEWIAVAACLARAIVVAEERLARLLFAAGVLCLTVGDVLFDFVFGGDPPYPSIADVAFLGFYPCCYVGLLLLVKSRISQFPQVLWVDGAMAAMATAALGAAALFELVLQTTEGSMALVLTNIAYPLGDILLLSGVVGVFSLSRWRPDRTWALIGAALALNAIGDMVFLFQLASDTYAEGSIIDALWPASLILLATAVWQRPGRTLVEVDGRPMLATMIVCGLVALGILSFDHFHQLNMLAICLAVATIVAVTIRTVLTFRENARFLALMRAQTTIDPLTGLGNRRLLLDDLAKALRAGSVAAPRMFAIYDLDGFKQYNDMFGHPAGDAMLARIATALDETVRPVGSSYRLGGDEFCVLADVPADEVDQLIAATLEVMSVNGDGFSLTGSVGSVMLPDEAVTPTDALRLADQRLYVQKREHWGRRTPAEALLQALFDRSPDLRAHVGEVVDLAVAVGEALHVKGYELEELRLAARLHDVGKLAIPDAVLYKPAPLDDREWAFMREHVLIGERILGATSGWGSIATIVRATHERWDGTGYVDGLRGEEIPLAARIIAVSDAYSAMTSNRPYRVPATHPEALQELRRCAGTQFDPSVVETFCTIAALGPRQESVAA